MIIALLPHALSPLLAAIEQQADHSWFLQTTAPANMTCSCRTLNRATCAILTHIARHQQQPIHPLPKPARVRSPAAAVPAVVVAAVVAAVAAAAVAGGSHAAIPPHG